MKVLTAPHMERCIGCLLCVFEASKESRQIFINNSLIRILPQAGGFAAEIDTGREASEEIVAICPRNCLSISES